MEHQNEANPKTVSRRGVLKTSALALGAALLPSTAHSDGLPLAVGMREQLKAEYDRRISEITDELGSRLLSREFRGFISGDADKIAKNKKHPVPLWLLEDEVRRRIAPTTRDALLVLACTDSAPDLGAANFRYMAGEVAAMDVLRLAAARGLYRPGGEESPSVADLNAEHLWDESDFEACEEDEA